MRAVLACIRLKGHHSYDVLAQAMIDIHYDFHIDKKITRLVTTINSVYIIMYNYLKKLKIIVIVNIKFHLFLLLNKK